MKKLPIFLTFSLLQSIFLCHLPAQDWKLFNQLDKYNYLHLGDSSIHTIWIDSVGVGEKASTMYFNSVFKFDTVYSDDFPKGILKGKIEPSAIFYQQYREQADTLFLGNKDSLLLLPHKGLTSKWAFSQYTTAEITAVYQDTVFNVADTVKHITISNGHWIKISKNFGILYWKKDETTEYKLIGIQNKYGVSVPPNSEYFDFAVGDVFQYELEFFLEHYSTTNNITMKYTITSENETEGQISYKVDGLYKHEVWAAFHPYFSQSGGAIQSWMNPKFPEKDFHGELIKYNPEDLSFLPLTAETYPFTHNFDSLYYPLMVKLMADGTVKKHFSANYSFEQSLSMMFKKHVEQEETFYQSFPLANYSYYNFQLREDIGLFSFASSYKGDYQKLMFKGAVIGGDSIGKVSPDAHFKVSSSEQPKMEVIQAYPNPFSEYIILKLENPATIKVYNTVGMLVEQIHLMSGANQIKTAQYKPGIYIIQVDTGKKMLMKRMVKGG